MISIQGDHLGQQFNHSHPPVNPPAPQAKAKLVSASNVTRPDADTGVVVARPREAKPASPSKATGIVSAASVFQPGTTEATDVVEYHVRAINEACGQRRDYAQVGLRLIQAKKALKHGQWQGVQDSGRLNMSTSLILICMRIARKEPLANPANSTVLPSSPDALAALARLDDATLALCIKDKRIHAGMTIGDAKGLVAKCLPAKEKSFNLDRYRKALERKARQVFDQHCGSQNSVIQAYADVAHAMLTWLPQTLQTNVHLPTGSGHTDET